MAALENDVFKLDKVTLTVVGSEPAYVPYMSIQDNSYSYGFVKGDDLKTLAVSILRRFDTKEAEQKSHNNRYMTALEVFREFLDNTDGGINGPFQQWCREKERLNSAKERAPNCT